MALWIRAICTRGIGALREIDLREATRDADFLMWGEDVGLDDDEAEGVKAALRFEAEAGERDVVLMRYRPAEPDRCVVIERWTGEQAAEEIGELLERIDGSRSRGVKRVRDVLSRAVETIGFELMLSDAQGMGWPIAWLTALWIARRGDGLVVTDDPDRWWDPASYKIILEE